MPMKARVVEAGQNEYIGIREDRNGMTNVYPTAKQAFDALRGEGRGTKKLARRFARNKLRIGWLRKQAHRRHDESQRAGKAR